MIIEKEDLKHLDNVVFLLRNCDFPKLKGADAISLAVSSEWLAGEIKKFKEQDSDGEF